MVKQLSVIGYWLSVWSVNINVRYSLPRLLGKATSFKKLTFTLFSIFLSLFSFSANAKILLPQILGNDMVLQRDQPVNIWGFGAVGEKVTINFAGQTKTTITDDKGNWLVVLSPLKTSAVPQKMTITGTNKIVLDNILVGEVWLCSGQSNMEYQMRKLAKIPIPKNGKLGFPKDEVKNARNKNIRIFLVNRKALIKPDSIHKSWSIAEDSALNAFSVVGYFFAKELQEKLNIPIGIISSSVSGSAIEPWVSEEALRKEEFFKEKKIGNDPGKFYTPMIEPLTKFKLRGFLWYQGETNCFLNETIEYAYKMKALINSWRSAWAGNEKMPFYAVQIAPFDYSKQKSDKVVLTLETEPNFWEAQQQLLRLPNTGMIATSDLNDSGGDLHPTYKWEVGRRLSLIALAKTYFQNVEYSGPIFKKERIYMQNIILKFEHLNYRVSTNFDEFTGFEIAGKDGKFVNATAYQKGNEIVVSSKEIKSPKYVRYNWSENPKGNLYSNNLPALPFRTNNPLINQFKIN